MKATPSSAIATILRKSAGVARAGSTALGVSDGNPNPIRWSGFTALQAAGFSDRRPLDSFGVGFFYTGLSRDFVDLASPLIAIEDPYGGELYYNAGLTPWFNLTADLQLTEVAVQV